MIGTTYAQLARNRQQELLTAAREYRLARSARSRPDRRHPAPPVTTPVSRHALAA